MVTSSVIKDSPATQPPKFEFQPDFSSALEREKNTTITSDHKATKKNLSLEDSFGSWREWD